MKRRYTTTRLFYVPMLLFLVASLLLPAMQAPVARAQAPAVLPFLPVTVANAGPSSSSGPFFGVLPISGNWLGYTISNLGCGHCGTYVHTIVLRDTVDARQFTIHAATVRDTFDNDRVIGAQDIQFAGPYLLWRQPARPVSPAPSQGFSAGDFDCSLCLFDVRTGQARQATALVALDPSGQGAVRPVALDAGDSGRVLVLVETTGAAALYLAALDSAEVRPIPAALQPGNLVSAALTGTTIVWSSTGDHQTFGLYAYGEAGNTVMELAAGPQPFSNLQTNGPDIFWEAAGTVSRRTMATGVVQPLAEVGVDFQVAGDQIAWTRHTADQAPVLLKVRQLSTGQVLQQQEVGQPAIAGGWTSIGLGAFGAGKIVLLADDFAPASGPPDDQRIVLGWTTPPDPAFARVWATADAAVAAGQAPRSWLWGPTPRFIAQEAYAKGPGGLHQVQYYDKSRMEVNNPAANPNDPYYVTNGLLAVEMVSAEIQTDDTASIRAGVPCTIPVVGDPRKDNPLAPGYAAFAAVASVHGEHQAPNRIGAPVDDAIDVHGTASKDAAHGALMNYATFVPQTGHNIPSVFETYLQGMAGTYGFDWTFVLGYPITEGYWTQMRVGGRDYPVLVQIYQRRVLTYVPDFAPVWQIQQGNVGQHYLEWRYTLNQ
jgi:hypothetical protein